MIDDIEKSLDKLNLDLINLVIFLLGVIAVGVGLFFSDDAKVISVSVGTSLIASSIIAYLSARYLARQSKVKEIMEKWGLDGIFETRSEMNTRSANFYLDRLEKGLDMIILGGGNFRNIKGGLIKEKVKKNVSVRILTLKPDSIFLRQREKDENKMEGEIKRTILQLIEWVDELKQVAPNEDNVQLKFYDTCPLDSYLRIDEHIYIGPNMYNKLSQQTISFEFKSNGLGYDYYNNYFNELWDDSDFCKNNID